jgi:hypothetical protein
MEDAVLAGPREDRERGAPQGVWAMLFQKRPAVDLAPREKEVPAESPGISLASSLAVASQGAREKRGEELR